MRHSRHSATPPRDTFAVAGWLFADLMLALVLVFIASAVPPAGVAEAAPTASPTPSPTATQRPLVTPSPSPTSCIRTAVLHKNSVTVPARSGGRAPSNASVLQAFRRFEGRQVGLLLTYGHGTTPSTGITIARDVNRFLRQRLKATVTERTITENFFNDAGGVGTVTFDVYLLAADCQ